MNKYIKGFAGLILVGLMALVAGSYDAYRTHQARQWPTAPAVIRSSAAERVFVGSRRGRHTWYPRVTYTYTVEGRTLLGRRISVSEGSLFAKLGITDRGYDYENATAVVNRYPSGAQVSVHYNPAHPEESVLETASLSAATTLLVALGGIGFLVGIFGWVKGRQDAGP